MARSNAFLFMGTNKPVKITDAKSGIIRRLIDVRPSGNKLHIKKLFEPYYNDFEIIECMEAGHYPMIECPVYFATEIENFCK